MDYKDGWNDLKDWVRDSIKYFDELAYKYVTDNNIEEYRRIDTRRTEYKNFYRKIEEIERVIK